MQTRLPDAMDLQWWIVHHDPLQVVRLDEGPRRERFDVRDAYVERYWLPVLGPSCVLALRRLADALEQSPHGLEIPLGALARSVGLGSGVGRCSPIVRTLTRLDDFGFAHAACDEYAVRVTAPPLSRSQVRRLPDFLAELHRLEGTDEREAAENAVMSREVGGSVGEVGPPTSAPVHGAKEAR
jgi:hypothetical protein